MASLHFAYERRVEAPASVVYHCLSDYREHHRAVPEGFLPPAFTRLDVLEGGVGAGTLMRFTTRVGGRSITRTQRVSEPAPGVLVESGDGEGSTFTVTPRGNSQCLLRIETTLKASGVEGLVLRAFGARILGPLYADEVSRLEQHAQAHAPIAVTA